MVMPGCRSINVFVVSNPPTPDNAYLTIVGDSQYFMEGGWRQRQSGSTPLRVETRTDSTRGETM